MSGCRVAGVPRFLPGRADPQRKRRQAGGAGGIDAGLCCLDLCFSGLEVRAAFARFDNQCVDIAFEGGIGRCGRQVGEREWLAGIQPHHVGQRTERVLERAFGLDAVEYRLRPGGLRLQSVGRCAGTDAIAGFGRRQTLLAGPFRFQRRGDGGARRLGVVVGLERSEEDALHGGIERRRGCAEQLAGVLQIGRARAEVVKQPRQRQRGAVHCARSRFVADVAGCELAVEIRQVGAPCRADERCLRARIGPGLVRFRVAAERQVDDFHDPIDGPGNRQWAGDCDAVFRRLESRWRRKQRSGIERVEGGSTRRLGQRQQADRRGKAMDKSAHGSVSANFPLV